MSATRSLQSVGFIHGVLNTDNMSILGEGMRECSVALAGAVQRIEINECPVWFVELRTSRGPQHTALQG